MTRLPTKLWPEVSSSNRVVYQPEDHFEVWLDITITYLEALWTNITSAIIELYIIPMASGLLHRMSYVWELEFRRCSAFCKFVPSLGNMHSITNDQTSNVKRQTLGLSAYGEKHTALFVSQQDLHGEGIPSETRLSMFPMPSLRGLNE